VILEGLDGGLTNAAYVELGTFSGQCPATDSGDDHAQLSAILGQKLDGHEVVQTSSSDGGLSLNGARQGTRAFFALVRDAQCSIVAWGCYALDLTYQATVTIPVHPPGGPPMGACFAAKAGPSCQCTAASEAGSEAGADDAGSEAGCSLIAAGSLPAPQGPTDLVAGPTVAATSMGFVIAFREQSVSAGSAPSSIRTVSLGFDGTPGAVGALPETPRDTCGQPINDDGVGLAFDPSTSFGLAAVSMPPCGSSTAGTAVFWLNRDATLLAQATISQMGASDFTLAPAHALIPSYASSNEFEVVSVSNAMAYDSRVVTGGGDSGFTLPIPDRLTPPNRVASAILIAASSDLRAQLIVLQTDAGAVANIYTSPSTSEPTPSPALVATVPAIGALSPAPALAVATTGVDASAAGSTGLAITANPLVGVSAQPFGSTVGPNAMLLKGPVSAVDLAAVPGSALGTFGVLAGAAADGALVFADNLGNPKLTIPNLSSNPVLQELLAPFDGSHVGVAWQPASSGSGGNLALTWLTKHALGPDDPTGGWAVLSCN
jgi:hypothetical protein